MGVVPVCYGDYHVTVTSPASWRDPNMASRRGPVSGVLHDGEDLAAGEKVEVSGYYWGGTCPNSTARVQIIARPTTSRASSKYGDDDWMFPAISCTRFPPATVGIADTTPEYRLELPNAASAAGQGGPTPGKPTARSEEDQRQDLDHAMDKVRDLPGVSFD